MNILRQNSGVGTLELVTSRGTLQDNPLNDTSHYYTLHQQFMNFFSKAACKITKTKQVTFLFLEGASSTVAVSLFCIFYFGFLYQSLYQTNLNALKLSVPLLNTWTQKQIVHCPIVNKSKMLVAVSGFLSSVKGIERNQ